MSIFGSKKQQTEILRAKITTLIGKDTNVNGDICFDGGLHVVGTVNGNVDSIDPESLLIVNEDALIKGNVKVNHLIVNGQIDGDIRVSEKVELFDKALINGDVYYRLLELPVGAVVNGKLIRIDE